MISLKNTLKAISSKFSALNTLLNDVPHYTLLWTNPNPTSSFSAQTISLDLSKYDMVEIRCLMHQSSDGEIMQYFKGKVGERMGMTGQTLGHYALTRECNVNTKSIVFSRGTGGGSNNNGAVIPIKIYGIKFGGGIRLSVLSSLRRWLYAKFESYLKSDWGEHHHNQECLGRKGDEVHGVWNACDSDNELVYDTERRNHCHFFGVRRHLLLCDRQERRREPIRRSERTSCRCGWIFFYHLPHIQRAKDGYNSELRELGERKFLRSFLSFRLMPKEVFA